VNRGEEYRLLGARQASTLPRSVTFGPHQWQLEITEATTRAGFTEATIIARAPDQPGARLVVIAQTEVVR